MNKTQNNGFVAIITVLFLCVLITMFTLGFARVMIRGQQSTLDSQLNSQAFYAAESGINDAIEAIKQGYVPPIEDTDCTPLNPATDTKLQTQVPIEYTCQLVSSGVKDIQYSAGADSPRTFPIFTNGVSVTGKDITVEWENDPAFIGGFHPGTDLPAAADWKDNGKGIPAMLRVTFYYLPLAANRDSFNNNAYQKTVFLTPTNMGDARNKLNDIADGSVIQAGCTDLSPTRPYACRTSFDMSDIATFTPQTYNTVFMRIVPIYHKTNVDIYFNSANQYSQTSQQKTSLYNAQYSIDSTGRANNIYKRIQVRIPYGQVSNPPNGITSSDFCKKYQFDKQANTIVDEGGGCLP